MSSKEEEKGIFKLTQVDGLLYMHTKNLDRVNKLLPCDLPNSAFLRMVKEGRLSKEDIDRCYFKICKYETVYDPLEIAMRSRGTIITDQLRTHLKTERREVHYDLVVVEPDKSNNIETMTELEPSKILIPPAYLDSKHPMFSEELSIAIHAWQEVLECKPDKTKTGSRKKLIEKWLETHHNTLTKEAKNRIATLLNPDKNGGAPSSD